MFLIQEFTVSSVRLLYTFLNKIKWDKLLFSTDIFSAKEKRVNDLHEYYRSLIVVNHEHRSCDQPYLVNGVGGEIKLQLMHEQRKHYNQPKNCHCQDITG
jgi:hypothetical protein